MSNILLSQNIFPLHKNDQWVYNVKYYGNSSGEHSFKVISDSVFDNGKKYFVFDKNVFTFEKYLRADSQFVYVYEGKDVPLFQLNGKVGDVVWRDSNQSFKRTSIGKIDSMTIFGNKVRTIGYLVDARYVTIDKAILAEKYGIVNYSYYDDPPAPWPSTEYTLIGCRIDNVEYGTKLDIEKSEDIPKEYLLSQNYPNPFNPITTISYQIPKQSKIILRVIDILGRELEILVSEEKIVGSFSVKFDGSNYSSGIYFYQLLTNGMVITKKFVLMK